LKDFEPGQSIYCPRCENLELSNKLEMYRKTKRFSQDSIPKGFLRRHSTKDGTWAKIIVEKGTLTYIADDLDDRCFEL